MQRNQTCLGTFLLLLFLLGMGGGAAQESTPESLLALFFSAPPASGEEAYVAGKLVAFGDAAIESILKSWTPQKLYQPHKAKVLVETITRIGTPAAVVALKRIIGYSTLSLDDLVDARTLATALLVPSDEKERGEKIEPSPARRIWHLLSEEGKSAIRQIVTSQRQETEGETKKADLPVPEEAKIQLLFALNEILERSDFYTAEDFAGLTLPEEGSILLARHTQERGTRRSPGLSPREVVRLNRILLETAFPKAIAPGPTSLDPFVFRGIGAETALKALSTLDLPQARAAIVTYKPLGTDSLAHIAALEKIPSPEAERVLFGYLLSPEPGYSARAYRALLSHLPSQSEEIARRVEEEIERLGSQATPPLHVVNNLLFLAASLPDMDLAARLLGEVLRTPQTEFRLAALGALSSRCDLVEKEGLQERLAELLTPQSDVACALATLDLLRTARRKETLNLAAMGLDHEEREVRVRAAWAMSAISGVQDRSLGRNPIRWKEWYQKYREQREG